MTICSLKIKNTPPFFPQVGGRWGRKWPVLVLVELEWPAQNQMSEIISSNLWCLYYVPHIILEVFHIQNLC